MLVGRRSLAEPGVVSDVDEEAGAVGHLSPGQIGKDGLVADQGAEGTFGQGHGGPHRPFGKVAHHRHHLADEGKKAPQRHVLAVGHQMGLVVGADGLGLGGQEIGPVIIVLALGGQLVGGAAEQQVAAAVPGDLLDLGRQVRGPHV